MLWDEITTLGTNVITFTKVRERHLNTDSQTQSPHINTHTYTAIFKIWPFARFIGDDVTVYGVVYQRWKPCYARAPCYVELVLKANNIEVTNRSNQQTSAQTMKDIQKEFEDFWKSYRHFPIAGRCVCIYLYQHVSVYAPHIHLFCHRPNVYCCSLQVGTAFFWACAHRYLACTLLNWQ